MKKQQVEQDRRDFELQTVRELWDVAQRAFAHGEPMIALKIIEAICHVIKGKPA